MNRSAMVQLDPTIPVITPDGKGEAIGWIDYSKDDDLLWIVFLQSSGECWIYPNPQIRACPNITTGRMPGVSSSELSHSIPRGKTPLPLAKNGKNVHSARFAAASDKSSPPKKNRMLKPAFS